MSVIQLSEDGLVCDKVLNFEYGPCLSSRCLPEFVTWCETRFRSCWVILVLRDGRPHVSPLAFPHYLPRQFSVLTDVWVASRTRILSGEYKQFGTLTDIEIDREGLPKLGADGTPFSRQEKIILLRRILSLYRGMSPSLEPCQHGSSAFSQTQSGL
jgi:hypothetical protein